MAEYKKSENKKTDRGSSIAGQKSSEPGKNKPGKASPVAIEKYLKGIHYPASKNDLVQKAKSNNAPSDVMHVLGKFQDKLYTSPIDVSKEVGRIE